MNISDHPELLLEVKNEDHVQVDGHTFSVSLLNSSVHLTYVGDQLNPSTTLNVDGFEYDYVHVREKDTNRAVMTVDMMISMLASKNYFLG